MARYIVFIGSLASALLLTPAGGFAQCAVSHGDLTGDGAVDVLDTNCMGLWLLGEWQNASAPSCLAEQGESLLDLNCDGAVNLVDGAIIQAMSVGAPLPVQVDATGNDCPTTCDTNPTLPGSPLPLWQLEDQQPASPTFGTITGPLDGTGVKVIALLDGG